jgi:antitoxin HicB
MSTIPAFEKYPFDIVLPENEGEECLTTFPDLPGCIASGATEPEAIAEARGAFHAWTAYILEGGKPIPLPHSATRSDNDS